MRITSRTHWSIGIAATASALAVAMGAPAPLHAQKDALLDSAYSMAERGAWDSSARAWRRVLDEMPALAGAAASTLRETSADMREAVRHVFLALPTKVSARLALGQLEVGWGAPREGWAALQGLPPTPATADAWIEFGTAAADANVPLVARDAFAAAFGVEPSVELAARAASAALDGRDPASALSLIGRGESLGVDGVTKLVPLRITALARLGRADDAERLAQSIAASLTPTARLDVGREIAWAYVRSGNMSGARAAAQHFGVASDPVIVGWLALYAGDLAVARHAFTSITTEDGDIVQAVALLTRTRADSGIAVGHAFTLLANGDSARAADAFVSAADSSALADAAPLLLAMAARLRVARHDDGLAVPIWRRVVERYPTAPEAPEADLEWGRALKRGSDVAGAIARWQHLVLTYPESALVPQARRELDLVKAAA